MVDFAINIETLYPGMDICEKIRRVSEAGFRAVEFWGWDNKDLAQISRTCKELGMKVRAFSGTKSYSLCDGEHRKEFIEWVQQSVAAAKKIDCDTLILFPNHFTPDGCADYRDKYSYEAMIANITNTLTCLVPILEENDMTVLLEPLCNIGSDAGMSVTDTTVGADIVRAVNSKHIKLLCDVYHMQVMHGNLLQNIIKHMDVVSYIHIADAPDRHEPGTGEINFEYLCSRIKESDFQGTICFEYFPENETEAGFPAVKRIYELMQ